MENRIYIVTGAAGHLGNTLVHMLLANGEQVRGLILSSDKNGALDGLNLQIIEGDVRDIETLRPLFYNPDKADLIVLHTAGVVSISSKFNQLVYDVNVKGTANIVKLCLDYKVKKLVHVSSVHAIPEPSSNSKICEIDDYSPRCVHGLYAKTKAAATQIVINSTKKGLDASVVQPSGILGGGDYGSAHLTQLVMDFLDSRLTASVKGGYDFVDVRDVAIGTLACVEHGRKGESYILSGRYYTVGEILQLLHEITGHKKVGITLPLSIAKMVAPMAEAYYKLIKQPPIFTAYSIYTLGGNAIFDHSKATEDLNYKPREIVETLQDMVEWLEMNNRIYQNK